ncbi:MAG TPA: hypothetical protein VLS85_13375 [Hanamia sp.]|nr:hypothetical protein [Hanamia sp.]
MFKDIKKLLWFCIVMAMSMFLLPTILLALGIDSVTYQNLLALLMIGGVIISVISGVIGLVIIYKSNNADRILQKADQRDQIWDEDHLKYTTRFVFYKMMNAWNTGDLSVIKDYVTAEYLSSFQKKLSGKTGATVNNIINSIDIVETRIICCQDFLNNSQDKFVGYIKWKFITEESEINNMSLETFPNEKTDEKDVFQESYHFKRVSNDWLLYDTDDNIGLWKLLLQKNYYQT